MKKLHLNRMLNSNERGAILIWLIFILVAAGILGSSMVYLTTSSTYDELLANNQARAYYMAEAGGRYVIPIMLQNPAAAGTGTYTLLDNSGEFEISNMDINNDPMTVVSEGIVNKDSWLEGRRTITYEIVKTSCVFEYVDQTCFDNSFCILDNDSATIFCDEKVDFDCAMRFKHFNDDFKMSINFDTKEGCGDDNCCILDLKAARDANTPPTLSYEMQIKIKLIEQGANDSHHYMFGLSFRLDTKGTVDVTDDDSYGISFFKSDDSTRPRDEPWFNDLDSSWRVLMPNEGEGCGTDVACSDGIDNDGDGLIDGADPDCSVTPCNDSTFCDDSIDNDGDGDTDFDDSECIPRGVYIVLWREVSGDYTLLDYRPLSVTNEGEGCGTDVACTDGIDNDGDGLIDGADPDCSVTPCNAYTFCSDGIDNDGDGDIDGADFDCSQLGVIDPGTPGELKDWSTIAVRVLESSSGNTISGYAQGTDGEQCCDRSEIIWDFDNPAVFNAVFVDNTDNTLRSSDPPTEEMGIHAFYDNPNNNDIFFDDFAVRIVGPDGTLKMKAIQY